MATIVVKLAPGEKAPEKGSTLAGGTVKLSFPGEPWVVVERNDYEYGAFEDDPRVMEHREEQIVKPMVMPETPRMQEAVSPGDTFPMCGVNEDVLRMGNWGEGTVIAIVDTGVYSQHEAFSGKTIIGDQIDTQGHGTHVASTAASVWGIASDSPILSKRVLDGANGEGSESGVALGLQAVADWAVANQANVVINLSLGGSASGPIDAGVRYCQQRGLWVVAAAGNDGPNATLGSPARQADFVVGAVDRNSSIASFSSGDGTWQQITCFMPGVGIAAAKMGTTRDVLVLSGTSMATPHLVGVLALLRRGGMNLYSARDYIYANMTDIGAQNRKGLFVVQANFAQSTPNIPVVTPPGSQNWQEDAVGITEEVKNIVTEAEASNWSDEQKSRVGSVINYMDQLEALFPKVSTPPVDNPPPPQVSWPGGTKNFQYGPSASDNAMSVAGPKGATNAPVVVLWAGGAWQMRATVPATVSNWFVQQGVIVAQPFYRLGNVVNCIQDGATAAKFVHDHCAEWGGNPENIYFVGHSAGGHIAWMCALDPRWGAPIPKGVCSLAGAALAIDASTKNTSFARFLQPWGDPNTWQSNSPWSHVSDGRRVKGTVVQGTADDQVPPSQAEAFVRACQSAGLQVNLIEQPGGTHFSVGDPSMNTQVAQAIRALWS